MDRSQRVPSRRLWRAAHAFAAAWLAMAARGAAPAAAGEAAAVGEAAGDSLPAIWAEADASLTHAADAAAPQLATEPLSRAIPQKNYVLPAAEIVGFSFLLNQYNRHFAGSDDY